MDASGEILERGIEGSIRALAYRVRNGPVQEAGIAEFFVGGVADGDHIVVCAQYLVHALRRAGLEGEAVPGRGGDRAGLDRGGRVRAR